MSQKSVSASPGNRRRTMTKYFSFGVCACHCCIFFALVSACLMGFPLMRSHKYLWWQGLQYADIPPDAGVKKDDLGLVTKHLGHLFSTLHILLLPI